MSGTKAGGLKAAQTNREKYGKEFYSQIGRKGGQNGHTGGFAANPALARIAGAKGGRISRRGPAKKAAQICNYNSKLEYRFGQSEHDLAKFIFIMVMIKDCEQFYRGNCSGFKQKLCLQLKKLFR